VVSEVKHRLRDQAEFPYVRAAMNAGLLRDGQLHLILVHYLPSHSVAEEWVYNRADIDRSRVVWARDLGADNKKLFEYFSDRKFWCLEADVKPWQLKPCGTATR
jgi:hypothetical protein